MKEKPSTDPAPQAPKCKVCGVFLMLSDSIDCGICRECRARAERIRQLAQRVNSGVGKRLGAAAQTKVMFG